MVYIGVWCIMGNGRGDMYLGRVKTIIVATIIRWQLVNNCFPKFMIDKLIKKFLDKKFKPICQIPTVPKQDLYFSFFHNNCKGFSMTLKNMIKKYYNCLDPKIILKNPRTIGSLFRFKDTIPDLMRSLVVYKYTCPRCKLGIYLGFTKRMLRVRIDSHRGVSHRTGNILNKKEFSNIREHAAKCKSNIKYDQFQIIAQAADYTSLPVIESLFIKRYAPSLNSSSSSFPLHIA